MGKEAQLPHKFLGLSTWLLRKETCQGMNIKNRVLRARKAVQLQGGKESRKQTKLGAEGGLGRGALERDEVQGDLLKALGTKHNKPIKTNHVPLAPSRAQRHSPQPG